jgi:hypothetical protein
MRPPRIVEELVAIPAIICLVSELEDAAAAAYGKSVPSQSAKVFKNAASADEKGKAKFMAHSGRQVLLLLRNYLLHVSSSTAKAQAAGLTEAVLDRVVREAAAEIVSAMGHPYAIDKLGALLRG